MTRAQDIITPVIMIAAMTLAVLGLMKLTAPQEKVLIAVAETSTASQAGSIETMAADWSGEIAWGPAYSALAPLSATIDAPTAVQFDPTDDYWGLPRGEGVETVAALCGACHSLAIVMQQRQTREGWDYLLDWMVAKQGMAPPPPEMRAEILAYLSREFAAE